MLKKANKHNANMKKTTILLVLSVILVITVCFSAAYAWFFENTSAKANVSGEVLSFYFTANGKFNEEIVLSAGDTSDNANFKYLHQPNGFYPGQEIQIKLTLSNKLSNLDAIYKITAKDINNKPVDCVLEVRDSNTVYYEMGNFENGSSVYPTTVSTDRYSADDSFAFMQVGQQKELIITIKWPYDYADIPAGLDCDYTDDESKNAGDLEYLSQRQDSTGKVTDHFSIKLDVYAEQVNN